jgi:hypothetical protein
LYVDWRNAPPVGWQRCAIIPRRGAVLITNPGVRMGPLTVWQPNGARLSELANLGGLAIAKLPLKGTPTVHEGRLGRGIRAFAAGERAVLTDEKKQLYVSIFDIFFSGPGADDTARNIREGVAFLFWETAQEADEGRLELARFVERVYRSRSETSHEFRIEVFEPRDLERLRGLALQFIERMATRQPFVDENKADIWDWIAQCREQLGRRRYEPYNAMSRVKLELHNP